MPAAIVTARRPGKRTVAVPDMTPEEHQQPRCPAHHLAPQRRGSIAPPRDGLQGAARAALAVLRHREPLPTPAEALQQPLAAFPSWFLRIECDHCGAMRMISERHGALTIREILASMRHDGCGGRPGRAVLLTGIGPVRKIVLHEG